ncbi:MAG: Gfo/Idh/MocA family oxidoreductase [Planctomycetota bacterium]|jgi:hypothetical protein
MNEITEKSTSRREFLKRTGRIAATSALAGGIGRRVYAGEDNTIRLALIGCGGRGTGAAADAFAGTGGPVKLWAMADLFENRLQRSLKNLKKDFEDKVDVPRQRQFLGFDAYKKAIDCLGPGDIAILTTHSAFRPLHFEYAVEKGVNVFMEKSFAPDAPGTRRLLRAAEVSEQKNLKVGVGFMWGTYYADLPGTWAGALPAAAEGCQRAGVSTAAPRELQLGVVGFLCRLALPQR